MKHKNFHRKASATLLAMLTTLSLLTASACSNSESEADTPLGVETQITVGEATMTFCDGISVSDLADETAYAAVTAWLEGCSASDRDEYFDAYTLRHESVSAGHITYTYLVYYPHSGHTVKTTPELTENGSGYVLTLRYTEGRGIKDDSLCRLTVTLPAGTAPRLRLLSDGEPLGVLSTVSETAIPELP